MSEPLEVLELLNSLGIAGPNIFHAEQGMHPDGKHSADDTWDGPGWCVCRRTWPCEALKLAELSAQLARQLLAAQERVAALEGALRVWAIATGPAHFTMTYHDHERCESIANADLRALAAALSPHE